MVLTPRTVGALVSALRRKDKTATIFAIDSRSAWNGRGEIDVDGRKTRVREARTALGLREVLHEARAGEDLVILTDLDARTFGRENLARVALRRIEPVQPWPIVRLLFGVASVDPRLVPSAWMAERLMQALPPDRTVAGGTLDLETAWSIVLGSFGLRSLRPSDEEFLEAASKPSFAQAVQALPAEGRSEFNKIIKDHLDRFGTTILSIIDRGYGQQLLSAGLVARCIFEVHDSHALSVRGAFCERFGVRGLDGVVAARWDGAVRKLLSRADSSALAPRVRAQADTILIDDLDGAAFAHASDDLPSGLAQRVRAVADLVERVLRSEPAALDLASLSDAARRVAQHAMAGAHGEAERAAMAARLARWLVAPRPGTSGLEAAVRRYAEEDCWVDRARIAVRDGESMPDARRAYQALADRVAAERGQLNAAFAPASIAALLPSGALIGVEHVLDQVVAPLAIVRPVALIVMDGMSHPIALDLVRALEEVGWSRYRSRSQRVAPLVLSTIPSVTEYARTSLLCGALRQGGQAEEREGFSSFLKSKSLGGPRTPTVFHKALLDKNSSDLEQAITSDAKVVACVVNAIDAQLDGSDQLRTQWNLRTIPVLSRLVRACAVAGRAIVLVSDHGHLVDEATEQLSATAVETLIPAARWRGVDGAVRAGELEARGPRVLAPGGSCVVAADERVRYGARHAGYHGGVTVQELACPLHVLVHLSNDSELGDWVPLDAPAPTWWNEDSITPPTAAQVRTVPRSRPKPAAAPQVAGGLFAPHGMSWVDALFASDVYRDQRSAAGRAPLGDESAREIIELFVASGPAGAASLKLTEQALAARLAVSVADTRKRITLLRNLLNVDGYEIIAQPDRDSLMLDVELLKTQFALVGGIG